MSFIKPMSLRRIFLLTPALLFFGFSGLCTFSTSADARAGYGRSFGSRGSRTWQAPPRTFTTPRWSAPMERSTAGRPYAPPANYYRSPYNSALTARRSHPFLSGLAGGFLGAGLFHLFAGHHGYAGPESGFSGSLFSFILQVVLFGALAVWVMRLWRGSKARRQGNAATPQYSTGAASTPYLPNQQDYRQFQILLGKVQQAWGNDDLAALRSLTTSEMFSYFSDQLRELTARGYRNEISNFNFIHGDLAESWQEGNQAFASVSLKWSMTDVTTDQAGKIVAGSPAPQTVVELWTFTRQLPYGQWILSAIQQAG